MVKKFNHHRFMDDQVIEALTCPVNRHCTRVEHNCDDWELFKHPEWLLQHFIENGGAKAFAKKREDQKYWEEEDKYELEKQEKETGKNEESGVNPTSQETPQSTRNKSSLKYFMAY